MEPSSDSSLTDTSTLQKTSVDRQKTEPGVERTPYFYGTHTNQTQLDFWDKRSELQKKPSCRGYFGIDRRTAKLNPSDVNNFRQRSVEHFDSSTRPGTDTPTSKNLPSGSRDQETNCLKRNPTRPVNSFRWKWNN